MSDFDQGPRHICVGNSRARGKTKACPAPRNQCRIAPVSGMIALSLTILADDSAGDFSTWLRVGPIPVLCAPGRNHACLVPNGSAPGS